MAGVSCYSKNKCWSIRSSLFLAGLPRCVLYLLITSEPTWRPSAPDNAVAENYHVNMSLLRLCAFSKGLTRSFAVDRCVRLVDADYCRLCLKIRNNGGRQLRGNKLS